METDYAAVPCNSLIPAFSFPTEYKIDIKLYGTSVHFNLIYICYIFIFSLELRINPITLFNLLPPHKGFLYCTVVTVTFAFGLS